MKFLNKGRDVQVRKNDGPGKFKWIILRTGEEIDLPKDVGKSYGFEEVTESHQQIPETTEGKIGEKKVETKQIEKPIIKKQVVKKKADYKKEIQNIKGIGKKTADDILKIYPEKEDLIKAISQDDELPFRDDVEKKLRRKYGK